MNTIAVKAEGLSKKYPIGGPQGGYSTLREAIIDMGKAPFRIVRDTLKHRGRLRRKRPTIWALKDLSFEIERGQVAGIIGRNGAGKSTLLKVLSRITDPTEGHAEIRGRVGSLLEVGTGFHPELTGRENTFLNGAILGMSRVEIQEQFDAIVEFAEVAKFIDTPVKHYSSGMYLRLAFAVAAHLRTEILLVDEVLAVGDVSFQRKCLGKMSEVSTQGRTVLFVSHNMGAVRSLCTSGMVIEEGRLLYQGPIGEAIRSYYELADSSERKQEETVLSGHTCFGPVRLLSHKGSSVQQGEPLEAGTVFQMPSEATGYTLLFLVADMHQRAVLHLRIDSSDLDRPVQAGLVELSLRLPPLWLEPGLYAAHFKILLSGNLARAKYVSDVLYIDVGGSSSGWGALLSPCAEWNIRVVDTSDLETSVLGSDRTI